MSVRWMCSTDSFHLRTEGKGEAVELPGDAITWRGEQLQYRSRRCCVSSSANRNTD